MLLVARREGTISSILHRSIYYPYAHSCQRLDRMPASQKGQLCSEVKVCGTV